MKNTKIRTFLTIMLVSASLSSYIYLNNASADINNNMGVKETIEQKESSTLALPDVALLKKAIKKMIFKPFQ